MNGITKLNLQFDHQKIIQCLPPEIYSKEFQEFNQLAITHSNNSKPWYDNFYDGVGSLYDFEKNEFKDTTASFRTLNTFFHDTYMEEVVDAVNHVAMNEGVSIGRIRLMVLQPRSCYTLHQDPEDFRYHIPLITNKNNFFVVDNQIGRMKEVGQLYRFRTKEAHTAVNASRMPRHHLVFDTFQ